MPVQIVSRVHWNTGAAYVAPGTVGFLGVESSLTPLTDPSGVISIGPGTYDGYYFQRGTYCSGAGNYTFRNCVFQGTNQSWLCLAYDANVGTGAVITFEDSTLRWRAGDDPAASQTGNGNIVNLGVNVHLSISRCDVSGMAIGVQTAGDVLIDQTWIHDPVYWGTTPATYTHGEAVAHYDGNIEIKRSHLTGPFAPNYSTACIFIQGSGVTTVNVHDNYLNGGGYTYYPENGAQTVVNNVFGPDHLFGTHNFADGSPTLTTWSGNTYLGAPLNF